MMNHVIENEYLRIAISPHGAELQSIKAKDSELEYLWQGNVEFWGRRSPVLFPFVGALKEGRYTYEGVEYQMGQHGFARDQVFSVLKEEAKEIAFALSSSEESLQIYPFHFRLLITYVLSGNTLKVRYTVENTSKKEMRYAIGAHPAFNCPLKSDQNRGDYAFEFSEEENAERLLISQGLRTGETRKVLSNASIIPIVDELFEQDALIFQGLRSDHVSLIHGQEKILTMKIEGFPYLGLWSKNSAAPFVCIEPWMGITDHAQSSGRLEDKEGLLHLSGLEKDTFSYEIVFH